VLAAVPSAHCNVSISSQDDRVVRFFDRKVSILADV